MLKVVHGARINASVLNRRLAVAALLIPVLAACSPGSAAPAPSATPDARAVLVSSLAGLTAGNYTYSVSRPGQVTKGVISNGSAAFTETTSYDEKSIGETEIRVLGHDQYSRSSSRAGGAWQHIDMTRVPERFRIDLEPADRTGATRVLATVQSAALDGRTVSGKVDGFQMTGGGLVTTLGLRERLTLPSAFTATLDEQGRIVRLVLDLPATLQPELAAGSWILDVTGYGTATGPRAPATSADQPDSFYAAF